MTSRNQPSGAPKSAATDAQPSAAHTPGPWISHRSNVISDAPVVGNIICDAPAGWPYSNENWPANARLIAAAPNLLWVCQAVVERAVSASDLRVFALAAISKATGAEQ